MSKIDLRKISALNGSDALETLRGLVEDEVYKTADREVVLAAGALAAHVCSYCGWGHKDSQEAQKLLDQWRR